MGFCCEHVFAIGNIKTPCPSPPEIILPAIEPVCMDGDSIILKTNIEGGTWKGNGVHDSVFNPKLSGAGEHLILYTYANQGCIYADSMRIQVVKKPEASFSYSMTDRDIQFSNESMQGKEFFWSFGDGYTSVKENPLYTYSANLDYTVQLVAVNECGADTLTDTLDLMTTAITKPLSGYDFVVYPNPSEGEFNILFTDLLNESITIQIHNHIGQLVFEEVSVMLTNMFIKTFDFDHLESGLYTLTLYSQRGYAQERIVIK